MSQATSSPPLRIMIVEDEVIVAMDLESILLRAGYGVAGIADSGLAALELAGREPANVAIVDIRLRGAMDGVELARRLRSEFNIPVVFGTAHGDNATLARASETQPFGYVLKPFDEQAIRIAVEVARARFAAEEKIKRLERWLATTLHSIGDAVIVADLDGKISLMNSVASSLSGWAVSDALGQPLASVFALSVDGKDCADEVVRDVMASGSIVHVTSDALLRTRSGELLPVDDSIAPTHDDSGHVTGVVVVFRDRTTAIAREERSRKLEARMYEAQRLESIGVLAGGIAHDFNNLLGIIVGSASLLLSRMPERADTTRYLRHIEEAGRRGAELCTQMLAYAGIGHVVDEAVDLNGLIESTLGLLQLSLGKNVQLRIELAEGLPKLHADLSRLRQVVMNLVINASEAIGDRAGTVCVRTRLSRLLPSEIADGGHEPRRCVTLEVIDDGEGIPNDVRRRMFDPFFTTKFQGRGLGLAAVRGIVDSHGGQLSVESTPGQGSSFRIDLPAMSDGTGAPSARDEERPSVGAHGRALLVDDEEPLRRISRAMLEQLGFIVDEASDGEEALRRVVAEPTRYRFILMDLTMPKLNGAKAAVAMHQVAPELRIMLMSGYTEDVLRSLSESDPFIGCLSKPFGLEELKTKLSTLLPLA